MSSLSNTTSTSLEYLTIFSGYPNSSSKILSETVGHFLKNLNSQLPQTKILNTLLKESPYKLSGEEQLTLVFGSFNQFLRDVLTFNIAVIVMQDMDLLIRARVIMIPIVLVQYEGLDKFLRLKLLQQPKSLRFVVTKVAMDGIIFGPLDLFVFFTYMGFSMGKNVQQVNEDVKRDFLPALVLEGGVWPIVQVVNFRYVPVRYQFLYVNIFCLMDSAFMSWVEQLKDAAWKQWFTSFSLKERGGQGRL